MNPFRIDPVLAALTILAWAACPAFAAEQQTWFINQYFTDYWKKEKYEPAERCSDAQFLRRASIDLLGRIPTVAEWQAFEKDADRDKRAKLIDKLLAGLEHRRHWAGLWAYWLLGRAADAADHDALRGWLEKQFANDVSYKDLVVQLLTAKGKSSDNPAVHFINANLGTASRNTAKDGQFDMVPLTERSVRLFLGYRPPADDDPRYFGDWKQQDFWGTNAFFRQVERKDLPADKDTGLRHFEISDNPEFNKDQLVFYVKKNGVYLPTYPRFLGRVELRIPKDGKAIRRAEVARFFTIYKVKDEQGKEYDQLARAHIERLWGEFFSRGLHEHAAADDFNGGKLIHPELLNGLTQAFADAGYDYKKLVRWIVSSDVYQLSTTANHTNSLPEYEVGFSRMPRRLMRPEQLVESVWVAVQPPESRRAAYREVLTGVPLLRERDWDDLSEREQGMAIGFILARLGIGERYGTLQSALREKTHPQTATAIFRAVMLAEPPEGWAAEVERRYWTALYGPREPYQRFWPDLLASLLTSSEFLSNR